MAVDTAVISDRALQALRAASLSDRQARVIFARGVEAVVFALLELTKQLRWRQFHGQSECLRLMGKGTFPGASEYRCLFSVVPVRMGALPAVDPGDFAGQGAA
jgi:hypothetical protein